MTLYNTTDRNDIVSLRQATLQSLAANKGLYMPEHIPSLDPSFFDEIDSMSFHEMSYRVVKTLFGDYIGVDDLRNIIQNALNFPTVLEPLSDRIYSLELWHGPSLAFKDYGARFMAALMSYFVKDEDKKLTILVATSGDTGGAVAFGFLDVPNIEVIILYPKGKVSLLQEKQLTTLGHNISACEVDGSFDDCQALVKEAFSDESLTHAYNLSSANSINIARLVPQMLYYFEAYRKLKSYNKKIVCAVPSGNFGNLTAGLMARRMGLPIAHFIAATNLNHVVPDYLQSGVFKPKPSVATLSNAMDVGNPSNFVRMLELYNHDLEAITRDVSGVYYDDEETCEEMRHIHAYSGYVSEPHGAIGHRALRGYLDRHPDHIGFFLETAHPAKFDEVVNLVLNIEVAIPERLQALANRDKKAQALSTSYQDFKAYLLARDR